MEIIDTGGNPLIVLSADDVQTWIREKVKEAGYSDRQLCAIQIAVKEPFVGGKTYHLETPELVVMVSNIRNSAS